MRLRVEGLGLEGSCLRGLIRGLGVSGFKGLGFLGLRASG